MKDKIHSLLKKFGYLLLNRQYMSAGISLERDIAENMDLRSVSTVFDVGANVGHMADHFRQIFELAQVHAFEPVSGTFTILNENVKRHGRIKTHQIGFSDKAETIKLYLQADHGLNSFNSNVNLPDEKNKASFENIDLHTIDEFCSRNGIHKIDLLKTDAEGLDLKIMRGAENMLKQKKIGMILSEVGFDSDNKRNTPFQELHQYLLGHGFKLRGFYDQSNWGNKKYMTCANALFMLQE